MEHAEVHRGTSNFIVYYVTVCLLSNHRSNVAAFTHYLGVFPVIKVFLLNIKLLLFTVMTTICKEEAVRLLRLCIEA